MNLVGQGLSTLSNLDTRKNISNLSDVSVGTLHKIKAITEKCSLDIIEELENLLPDLIDQEYNGLLDSIRENGQKHGIELGVLVEGMQGARVDLTSSSREDEVEKKPVRQGIFVAII